MARVIPVLFATLLAGGVSSPAGAAGGTLLVMPDQAPDTALQRTVSAELADQGVTVDEFVSVSRLNRRVELIPIRPGVMDSACLERIEVSSWQRDARRVEMLVQTFRGRQALDLIERLEDQLVCVDGLLSRRTLRDLGIHRVLAMSLDGAGLLELEQAVERLRALGDDLVTPSGLPPEIQSLIQESKTRRDQIRVFGGGPDFDVHVDGESLRTGAVLREQGRHLVQLVEARTGRVSTAQWVELDRGPVLLWGGNLGGDAIREATRELTDEGEPSPLLRTLSTVLRNTLLVAEVNARGFRILHVDGRVLHDSAAGVVRKARPASTPPVRERPDLREPPVDDAPVVVRASVDRRFALGVGVTASYLGVSGRSATETGMRVWGRYWGAGDLGGTASLGVVQQPLLLVPVEEDFYDLQLHVPLRVGGVWSPKSNPLQPELAVHLLAKIGHDGSDRVGAGLSVGVLAPVWGLNGLRVQGYSEFGGQWWSSGITVGSEWALGVEH